MIEPGAMRGSRDPESGVRERLTTAVKALGIDALVTKRRTWANVVIVLNENEGRASALADRLERAAKVEAERDRLREQVQAVGAALVAIRKEIDPNTTHRRAHHWLAGARHVLGRVDSALDGTESGQ